MGEREGPRQQPTEGSKIERRGRVDGRIALVTGGNHGIGRATVEKLAMEGSPLIYVISRGPADDVALEVAKYGTRVVHIPTDISEITAIRGIQPGETIFSEDPDNPKTPPKLQAAGVERILTALRQEGNPKIDILINNVGQTFDRPVEDENMDNLMRAYATNLFGHHMLVAQLVKNRMIPRGGSIVYISSVVGKYGNFMQEDYAGTKGADVAEVKSLAKTLARLRIRVNAVLPGFTDTRLTRELISKTGIVFPRIVPAGRIAKPMEIANGVVWLASDEASYVTGAALDIDGGLGGALGALWPMSRPDVMVLEELDERDLVTAYRENPGSQLITDRAELAYFERQRREKGGSN